MKTTHKSLGILALALIISFMIVPVAVHAGSLLGTPFVIRADGEEEVSPAVAYNSQRKEYLVVWYNDRPGEDDIRAQRIGCNGGLIGPAFYISAMNAERRYPDVAYNSGHDQYLVVWEQYEAANGYSIKARRVSGEGQVLDSTDIAIRGPGLNFYTPLKPAVAYASTADRYLVVWAETWHPLPITYSIEGLAIDENGAAVGSQFSISQGSESREEPDVAYNRHANRYLVVWQLDSGALYDIHGQQVLGGGGLYQGDITIAWFTKSCTAPAVAALPTTPTGDKFLVVWEVLYVPPNDRDIYGRLVQEDGTTGTDFWISWANGEDENAPAVAGDEGALQYFVAWSHPLGVINQPIRGRSISYTGTLVGQEAEYPGIAADNPAVAAGATGDILTAWQDRTTFALNIDLFGQLWGNRMYLPMMKK